MWVIHRVSIGSTPDIRRELATMGIFVAEGQAITSNVVTFEVDESHASWPSLRAWIARRHALDVVMSKFSMDEVEAAQRLELQIEWHHGYPQPNELDFGYREVTYDLTDYCPTCGAGMRQKAAFQMKGEPKWGDRGILQLNWIFDEYFVTPSVWTDVFKPHGIHRRPVTSTSGAELNTVVQLVVDEEVEIATDGLANEKCPICGRVKYLPITHGLFPPLTREPATAITKTKQDFGSGALAFKAVLISREVARTLLARKVRGVSLRPVAQST